MECNRVSHVLLKLKVSIVEEVFIHIASSSLRCHVVHCTRPLGQPQGDTQGSTEARAELRLQVR